MRRMSFIASTEVRLVSLIVIMVGGNYPTETFAAGPYQIDWYTIDSGGGTSSGGPYTLTGTIGQPVAGWSESGKYELLGGFWSGGSAVCIVDFGELAAFCDHWLETGAGIKADLDKNKRVDFVDYSILVNLWLDGCPYP